MQLLSHLLNIINYFNYYSKNYLSNLPMMIKLVNASIANTAMFCFFLYMSIAN